MVTHFPAAIKAFYMEPDPEGNEFACATCHALEEPAPDGYRRPGHPIGDAANRPSFKNGQLSDLRDAANSCRVDWMTAPPLSADDPRWLALFDYLRKSRSRGFVLSISGGADSAAAASSSPGRSPS